MAMLLTFACAICHHRVLANMTSHSVHESLAFSRPAHVIARQTLHACFGTHDCDGRPPLKRATPCRLPSAVVLEVKRRHDVDSGLHKQVGFPISGCISRTVHSVRMRYVHVGY